MTLEVWSSFSKPQNSTKQPTGTPAYYDVKMKRDTSLLNPVFIIDGVNLAATYCRLNGRYYFIDDIVLQNGSIYELHCHVDSLATWKSTIGSSTQYVLRSSYASDGSIVDGFYPTKKSPRLKEVSATTTLPWATSLDNGWYVVGTICGDNALSGIKQGVVKYWAMSPTAFDSFAQSVFTDANWSSFTTQDRYTFNPIQYISSIQWFPFEPPHYSNGVTGIKLGWERIPVSVAYNLLNPIRTDQYLFQVDKHPQASTRGSYLNASPFSEYVLKFPCFGDFVLDGTILADIRSTYPYVIARQETDFITGRSRLIVSAINDNGSGTNYKFSIREVQFGVNIQIAQIAANRLGLVEGLVSDAVGVTGSLFTGNIAGAVTGTASAIISAYQTSQPRVLSSGSNDSLVNIISTSNEPALFEIFHLIVDEDNATCGRPLCQQKTISTVPGYILCANAEISIAGFSTEREEIVRYMNSGFFYE